MNGREHGPYCVEPDEVGSPGMCCCDGTPEDIGRQRQHAGWKCPGCPHADGSAYLRDCAWPDCLKPPVPTEGVDDG